MLILLALLMVLSISMDDDSRFGSLGFACAVGLGVALLIYWILSSFC